MNVKENCTKPLRKLLKDGGVWMTFPYEKYGSYLSYLQIFRFLYFFVVWLLLLCSLLQEGVKFLSRIAAIFIPLGGVLASSSFVILMQSKKLERLVDQCEINLSSYKRRWEIDIIKRECNKYSKFINFGKLGFISFAIVYISLPLLIDCIRAVMGYSEPYYLPLPLEGYLEADTKRGIFYYFIVFACDIWFLESITLTNAFEGLILYMVSYNITELQILRKSMEMLGHVASEETDDGISLLKPWKMKRIIKYHEQIIRLNMLQNDCITSPYILQNLTATLSLASVMFLIQQDYKRLPSFRIDVSGVESNMTKRFIFEEYVVGENTMMFLISGTFIVMILVLLFVVCYAGEHVQTESEGLFIAICKCPWYRQSTEVKKDILLILTQLSKPLVLEYKRNVINLPAFMQMMNNSYSFFMLINSVKTS